MNGIEILLQAIRNDALLGPSTFANAQANKALSGRDDPVFEHRWLRLFDELKDTHTTEIEMNNLEQLREAAFKAAFKYCGNSDLSGYISDDFELISKGYANHHPDDFLAALLKAYLRDKIPHGVVADSGTSLKSLFDELRRK
jgi:hypothetical protein